ncbi:hypothetical protein GBAR_LOCUS14183, partial [Geodia barretti]
HLSTPVSTTSTQTPAVSSQDPCSSVHSYIESHPDCSVYDLREGGCSEVDCHWNNSYIAVDVDECKDPVTVEVNYATWTSYDGDCIEDLSNSFNFFYFYNQSEIVDNYKVRKDTGRYSAILARNASHLGFEVRTRSSKPHTTKSTFPVAKLSLWKVTYNIHRG